MSRSFVLRRFVASGVRLIQGILCRYLSSIEALALLMSENPIVMCRPAFVLTLRIGTQDIFRSIWRHGCGRSYVYVLMTYWTTWILLLLCVVSPVPDGTRCHVD
jgi:hypothetical protein